MVCSKSGQAPIEPILFDGQSNTDTFKSGATYLLNEKKVDVVFGCWSSASRKTVKLLFEKTDNLLFYPAHYEGLEQSPNIVYSGSTPNQLFIPTLKWAMKNIGKRVFIAGSDTIFAHASSLILTKQIYALGGNVVDVDFLPPNQKNVTNLLATIARSKPDIVLNLLGNSSHNALLTAAPISPIQTSFISFRPPPEDFSTIKLDSGQLNTESRFYIASSYSPNINTATNQSFSQRYRQLFGTKSVINAAMVAAYSNVHLWAKTVISSKTTDPTTIRVNLQSTTFVTPEGTLRVSALNNHVWKPLHISEIRQGGSLHPIWSTNQLIRPKPYPGYRTRPAWGNGLLSLYNSWSQHWEAQSQ